MYNSSETSTRIKKLAQEKGIQMIELQKKCGLSKNTITQSGKSQEGMKAKNLYSIAELLNCSVDYLLGRVDTPNGTYTINNQNTTVSGTQANVINHNVTASENTPDTLTEQFIQVFRELDFKDKVDVMKIVTDKIKK